MSVHVTFTLTPEEFRTAMRQLSGRELRRKGLLLWAMSGGILLLVLALVALSLEDPLEVIEPTLSVGGAWLLSLIGVLILAPRMTSGEIAPGFLEPTEFRADDESVAVNRPNFAGSGSWAHFRAWRELRDFVVLAHSPSVILVLPKRAFDESQLAGLRELLGRAIPSGGR